jgi:hypothetical protein
MRTVGLMSLMVVLMVGVSVNAQKQNGLKPKPPIIQFDHDLIVEDDLSGSFLIIDPMSGDYKFYRCSDGFTLSGTGAVRILGCGISFEDLTPGRRVLASIDECTQQAKAVVETFAIVGNTADVATIKESLGDTNMRNNTMGCSNKIQPARLPGD